MGNRLTLDFNETTTEYEYDAADQLTSVDETAYDYDDNGNLVERGSDTFAWDHENRLIEAEIDSVTSTYAYNGDGLRMSRTVGMASVDYYWDSSVGLPVVLQDSDGNSYIYGLELIARVDDQDNFEYYLYDGLGSVTGVCDETGALVATYEYDVFGALRGGTGSSANEFTFAGEQVDPTDLQFLRARYYDMDTGRFLSRDPIPFMQRYAYVENNPVNFTDPSGMLPLEGGFSEVLGSCAMPITRVPTPPPTATPTPPPPGMAIAPSVAPEVFCYEPAAGNSWGVRIGDLIWDHVTNPILEAIPEPKQLRRCWEAQLQYIGQQMTLREFARRSVQQLPFEVEGLDHGISWEFVRRQCGF